MCTLIKYFIIFLHKLIKEENMIDIQQNLENILPYRPNWSEDEKTAYTDNLNYINAHHDKLLKVHNDVIEESIHKFDYLPDILAEFIASYLRGKMKNETSICSILNLLEFLSLSLRILCRRPDSLHY